jgi:vitamin B12 transporter
MQLVRLGAAFAAASGLLVSTVSFADPEAARGAEAVVVTAARVAQPLSEVIGSVSVITRQDIEDRAVQSLPDLLRGETGLSVTNTGGFGKLSNVFLRGTDAEQVLVLIDGVRVGSVTSGTASLEFLPVDQIERIEIIRGPRSSLYGSDAIGGVIQIFTRRSDAPSFSAGFGSNETSTAGASFGGSSTNGWVSLAANHVRTEGFNSCAGSPNGGGCFTDEPDRDGYDNTSGSVRAGYRWSRTEIETTALYATGTTEYDSSFTNETDFRESAVTLRGTVNPLDRWTLSLLVGNSHDDQKSFYNDPASEDSRAFLSRFDTERRHASLQSDFTLTGTQALTVGIDYFDDRVDSTTEFDARSRDNVGVFAQYQLHLGAHRWQASARRDDNEQFGDYETGSVGWKWAMNEHWFLTAGWGRAFGAPTFNDLYYPGFSNPELDPETSNSYELGLGWSAASFSIALAAFENRVDDLVVYDASVFIPNNLNSARIRGIEADLDATLGMWTISLGYTGLDPRNRTPGTEFDNLLPRRPRHTGHVEIGRAFGALDARMRVTAEGSRYDDVGNTTRTGGYALVDLVADYRIAPAWTVQAKIGNALDRDYRTVRLYNQDDRTFFVTLRYQAR